MKNKSPYLQSIVEMMNTRRYARKTITAYIHWIRYFIALIEDIYGRSLVVKTNKSRI